MCNCRCCGKYLTKDLFFGLCEKNHINPEVFITKEYSGIDNKCDI